MRKSPAEAERMRIKARGSEANAKKKAAKAVRDARRLWLQLVGEGRYGDRGQCSL